MNRRKILAAALCTVLFSSMVLGGCEKPDSTPDEAETSPVASSSVASETTIPVTKADKTQPTEKVQTVIEQLPEDVYVPDYNSEAEEEDVSDEPCTVNVDGKAYTAYIGDTVNYVFYLKTPEALEDFQATTNYDSSMLELVKTSTAEMFPIAGEGVVCNTDMPNTIKFNAVNLSGMDFRGGGNLISLKFRILDSGSVAISTTLEYMDSVKSEPYVSDYRIVGDIEYSEEII